MGGLENLLRRFGFAKLRRYGLVLTPDDRILTQRGVLDDGYGGRIVGWRDADLAAAELAPWESGGASEGASGLGPRASGRKAQASTPPPIPKSTGQVPIPMPIPSPVAVAAPAPAPPVVPANYAVADAPRVDEDDEWAWQIAIARARAEAEPAPTASLPPAAAPVTIAPPTPVRSSPVIPIPELPRATLPVRPLPANPRPVTTPVATRRLAEPARAPATTARGPARPLPSLVARALAGAPEVPPRRMPRATGRVDDTIRTQPAPANDAVAEETAVDLAPLPPGAGSKRVAAKQR